MADGIPKRSTGIADGTQFILPVVVDETSEQGVRVPEEFNQNALDAAGGWESDEGVCGSDCAVGEGVSVAAEEVGVTPAAVGLDRQNPWPGLASFT